mmetsp:Transcript_3293/g.5307  ORF Transcript_3293/g.5307 Transcript_3293/m.5307 type:complete len:683 (+) Transcript_3293:604-2652(+)
MKQHVEELQHQNEMMVMKLQYYQRKHDDEMRLLQTRHESEIGPAHGRLQQVERELLSLKAQVELKKERILDALQVTRHEYEELAQIPEEQRDLQQALAVALWKMLDEFRKSRDAARREAETLRQHLKTANKELEDVHSRWEESQKSTSDRHVEHSKTVSEIQSRSIALQKQNDELASKLALYEERSRRTELAEREAGEAGVHRKAAEDQLDILQRETKKLEAQIEQAESKAESSTKVVSMMELDKDYLQRQVKDLKERCERAEEKLEKRSMKQKDAERAKEQLEQQIMQMQALNAASSEERLQAELSSLRQRAEQEMRDIKRSTAELYERQHQMLQDARDEALAASDRLRSRLDQVEQERDTAVREHSHLTATFETQVSEVRSMLKVKSMELERLQVSYEDSQRLLGQVRLESEMYREKLDLLKNEYFALQTNSSAKIAELETTLQHTSLKGKTLEDIEGNLNLAVDSLEGLGETEAETQQQLLSMGAGIAHDPQRRAAQVITLVRKVVSQQKEIASLRQTVQDQELQITRVQDSLREANKLLDNTSQPHNFLVQAVRARDEELEEVRMELQRLGQVLEATKDERDQFQEQCLSLKRDLVNVVEKQNTSENLQAALLQLHLQQKNNLAKLGMVKDQSSGIMSGKSREKQSTARPGLSATAPTVEGQPPAVWFTKLKGRHKGA